MHDSEIKYAENIKWCGIKLLETKNIITIIRISINSLNNRLNLTKERISELEGRLEESAQYSMETIGVSCERV